MTDELKHAAQLLVQGNYTCVLYAQGTALTDTRRGIRPLMELLESGKDLQDYCAADRVVGKGAAFLYILLQIRAVYARVISTPAKQVLSGSGIVLCYDTEVPAIENRSRTGLCPIETAVWNLDDPKEALSVIRTTLEKL